MSVRWKWFIALSGLGLALLGLPFVFGSGCLALVRIVDGYGESSLGIASLVLLSLTAGCGGVTAWHAWRALRGRPSMPLRLLPTWALAGIFAFLIAVGLVVSEVDLAAALFLPPIFLAAALLPPLWAVSWFVGRDADTLTWRRGWVAFAGGATVSVFVALVVEILFPTILLALVLDLAEGVLDGVEAVFEALADADVAAAITRPGFLYLFVQLAVVAPIAEELAKPVVTLPLVGQISRQDAFWVGAMAGAGFAALENVIYAGFGLRFWAGILVVRALGSAIHPLGAGLVALGWRDVLCREKEAGRHAVIRAAIAVGVHALWNGGSLLVITLAGAQFFGELPPEIDVLGLSAAGTTLAMLIVLGLAALGVGRAISRRLRSSAARETGDADAPYVLSERTMALWALICLVAIVPAGITGLQILLR